MPAKFNRRNRDKKAMANLMQWMMMLQVLLLLQMLRCCAADALHAPFFDDARHDSSHDFCGSCLWQPCCPPPLDYLSKN